MEASGNNYRKSLGELDSHEVGDVEDPDAEDSLQAGVQRKHMLELYSGNYPELRLAFEDWERSVVGLQKRVERGREVAKFAKKEVWHLVRVFLAVNGGLLVTLWLGHLLTCENWWTSFCVSILATIVLLVVVVLRVKTWWSVEARVESLLLAQQVLSRRIHDMKTLGPLECTFDEKADAVVMSKVLKTPNSCIIILRTLLIATAVLAFVILLMLGTQFRCEGSTNMGRRFRAFFEYSPESLGP